MDITMIGIDIAKNNFQLWGVNSQGVCQLKKKLTRQKLLPFIAQIQACTIVLEAGSGANHWHRQMTALGHQVKIIAPQFVTPFVKTNKNDLRDAEGIVEAASRPGMRFVTPKNLEQQDYQSLLRIREGLIAMRTKLANQIRGLLAEYGLICPKGIGHLRSKLAQFFSLAQENGLTPMMKELLANHYEMFISLDQQINGYTKQVQSIAKSSETARRLMTMPGIGPLSALALITIAGNGKQFKNGRHFAAFLGLVPKQHSSGGREKLLGISKRGDGYLRRILVQGARSVMRTAPKKKDRYSRWIVNLMARKHSNKVCVAIANKNARIAWAILKHGETFGVSAS